MNTPLADTWMTYTDICSWFVTGSTLCDANGRVSSLFLENIDLQGTLAKELFLVGITLEKIYITRNEIKGTIPTELFQLTELRRLRLNDNRLEGSIPTEIGNIDKICKFLIHLPSF